MPWFRERGGGQEGGKTWRYPGRVTGRRVGRVGAYTGEGPMTLPTHSYKGLSTANKPNHDDLLQADSAELIKLADV